MLKESNGQVFSYKKLTKEEMNKRNILGRLIGPAADFINPTRNGRKYPEQLWENVFNSETMREKIANHVCFGELGHPTDREEVDMEKVAICLAEQPVKNKDGKLIAVFDILDTPNGRILKTLCDYGAKIGISSRGSGDVYPDADGTDTVDPDSYNCECWDAVLIPAVKEARLAYVTESLEKTRYNKTLKKALTEELEKASDSDRKVMESSLANLDININQEKDDIEDVHEPEEVEEPKLENEEEVNEEGDNNFDIPELETISEYVTNADGNKEVIADYLQSIIEFCKSKLDEFDISVVCDDENCVHKDEAEDAEEVVDDKLENELTNELAEMLQKINSIEKDNLVLQEKLSVCNAKEVKLQNTIAKYKAAVATLSEDAHKTKELTTQVSSLQESLKGTKDELLAKDLKLSKLFKVNSSLKNELKEITVSNDVKADECKALNEQLKTKERQLQVMTAKTNHLVKALNESKESYKKAKADCYGLNLSELNSKLNESYSIKDVDKVCKEMADTKLNLDSMTIKFNKPQVKSVKVSNTDYLARNSLLNNDDEVSGVLLNLLD